MICHFGSVKCWKLCAVCLDLREVETINFKLSKRQTVIEHISLDLTRFQPTQNIPLTLSPNDTPSSIRLMRSNILVPSSSTPLGTSTNSSFPHSANNSFTTFKQR